MRRDLLSIIEAAYAVDLGDRAWLDGLAQSVLTNVPFRVLGVVVNGYDISNPARPRLAVGGRHLATPDAGRFARWDELVRLFEADPESTRASYGSLDEGLGLEIPGAGGLAPVFASMGIGDVYGVNGRNPSGRGVFMGLCLPPGFAPLSPGARRTFARIARHVAAAYRLRLRLKGAALEPDSADAVLTPDGAVAHASGEAKAAGALEALRRSVVAVSKARGRTRQRDPEQAVEQWRALVDARWSLVDHFERGGRHYLVAQRNDCAPAPVAVLTQREQQVVALAATGHSNKAIAYDLGLATSTVGVLISRALKRLGLRSRRELKGLVYRA